MTKDPKKSRRGLYLTLSIVFGVLIVLVVLGSTIPIPYVGMAIYTENQPYTDTECNEVQLKYVTVGFYENQECTANNLCRSWSEVCVQKNWYGGCVQYQQSCDYWACSAERTVCRLTIRNIDDTGGNWYFELDAGSHSETQYLWIDPTMENTVYWYSEILPVEQSLPSCEYYITDYPTKTVCQQVIKEREVEKQKEVMNYHTFLEWMQGK